MIIVFAWLGWTAAMALLIFAVAEAVGWWGTRRQLRSAQREIRDLGAALKSRIGRGDGPYERERREDTRRHNGDAMLRDDSVVRNWVCNVVRSGYHNGAHCGPREPHTGEWRCGWRYELAVGFRRMRGVEHA
ncbi:MAG: hypothetical protein ACRDQ7_15700 [Haloechinothrix sp.]